MRVSEWVDPIFVRAVLAVEDVHRDPIGVLTSGGAADELYPATFWAVIGAELRIRTPEPNPSSVTPGHGSSTSPQIADEEDH